jgi:hypothetical protein
VSTPDPTHGVLGESPDFSDPDPFDGDPLAILSYEVRWNSQESGHRLHNTKGAWERVYEVVHAALAADPESQSPQLREAVALYRTFIEVERLPDE